MKTNIQTPIGEFNINMPPGEFSCRENTGVDYSDGIEIKSCLTKVVFESEDGKQEEISPVVTESCMNPGTKVIVPVTYKIYKNQGGYMVTNTYKEIIVGCESNIRSAMTKEYKPEMKKKSCSECQNCGRC